MRKVACILLVAAILLGTTGALAESVDPLAQAVINFLLDQNRAYADGEDPVSAGDISLNKRLNTAQYGQQPYAVIIACSDSRVPVEHIFNAGIGELFVIRTAGNVIGDYELGSVEYGAEHLGARVIMVLGHTQCGAVDAAINGGAHGHIKTITDEIAACLPGGCDARQAEILNVQHSMERIRESEMIRELEARNAVVIVGAIYDITYGDVTLLDVAE